MATGTGHREVTEEEFDEILAEEIGMDVKELRAQSEEIPLGDPWEAKVVSEEE